MHNDARNFSEKMPLETQERQAHFNAYIKEAIRQALRQQPAEMRDNSTVLYHRAFPIGSALADIFAHRAVRDGWPITLLGAIEVLMGASIPGETPEQQARRGILCGLFWQLTGLLKMGGNNGFQFNVHDESAMLMSGVRKGRSGDAEIIRMMTAEDDDTAEGRHV